MHGHTPLRLGAGLEQVGKSFRLDQVYPVIGKGPAGKFPGLRQSHAIYRAKDFKHRIDHRRTTMNMKLCHIFTGRTQRSGHPNDEPLVDDLSGPGKPQLPYAGPAG
jgi:hypothetical protein